MTVNFKTEPGDVDVHGIRLAVASLLEQHDLRTDDFYMILGIDLEHLEKSDTSVAVAFIDGIRAGWMNPPRKSAERTNIFESRSG